MPCRSFCFFHSSSLFCTLCVCEGWANMSICACSGPEFCFPLHHELRCINNLGFLYYEPLTSTMSHVISAFWVHFACGAQQLRKGHIDTFQSFKSSFAGSKTATERYTVRWTRQRTLPPQKNEHPGISWACCGKLDLTGDGMVRCARFSESRATSWHVTSPETESTCQPAAGTISSTDMRQATPNRNGFPAPQTQLRVGSLG